MIRETTRSHFSHRTVSLILESFNVAGRKAKKNYYEEIFEDVVLPQDLKTRVISFAAAESKARLVSMLIYVNGVSVETLEQMK